MLDLTAQPGKEAPSGSGNSPISLPPEWPALAGMLVERTDSSVSLQGPRGELRLSVPPDAGVYAVDEAPITLDDLSVFQNLAVWGAGNPSQVEALQVLPPLADLQALIAFSTQPEPTGETRPLGPLTAVTRAGWGAADPDHNASDEYGLFHADTNPEGWLVYTEPLAEALNTIVVHHSALSFTDGPREIQQFHMERRGYADLAYHFVIDGFGQLYEGRALSARGAHTGGANTGTVGIVLLGDYSLVPLLRAPLETLGTLVAYLAEQYAITHLAGHRDFQPDVTQCPGDNLEAFLPDLAVELGLAFGTEGYVPPPWAG